ncbi:hypothetical protein ABIA65_002607 [Mycolicibacterium sp. 624]
MPAPHRPASAHVVLRVDAKAVREEMSPARERFAKGRDAQRRRLADTLAGRQPGGVRSQGIDAGSLRDVLPSPPGGWAVLAGPGRRRAGWPVGPQSGAPHEGSRRRTQGRSAPGCRRRVGGPAGRRGVAMLLGAGPDRGTTGLRKGEALAMRWDRVDLGSWALKVAATIGSIEDRLLITESKTARSRRTVPLTPVVATLRRQRTAQKRDRARAGCEWADSGPELTNELGGPVKPRSLLRVIEVAAKAARVQGVGVHTLPHFCGRGVAGGRGPHQRRRQSARAFVGHRHRLPGRRHLRRDRPRGRRQFGSGTLRGRADLGQRFGSNKKRAPFDSSKSTSDLPRADRNRRRDRLVPRRALRLPAFCPPT